MILLQCSSNRLANALFLTSAVAGVARNCKSVTGDTLCHVCDGERSEGERRGEEAETVSNTCKWKLSQLDNKPRGG